MKTSLFLISMILASTNAFASEASFKGTCLILQGTIPNTNLLYRGDVEVKHFETKQLITLGQAEFSVSFSDFAADAQNKAHQSLTLIVKDLESGETISSVGYLNGSENYVGIVANQGKGESELDFKCTN